MYNPAQATDPVSSVLCATAPSPNGAQILGAFLVFSGLFHALIYAFLTPPIAVSLSANWSKPVKIYANQVPGALLHVVDVSMVDALLSQESGSRRTQLVAPRKQQLLPKNNDPKRAEKAESTTPSILADDTVDARSGSGVLLDLLPAVQKSYFRARDVEVRADVLLPIDTEWFDEQFMLSGRLKLDIYVRADGVVEHIDILEAMDVSGALRESVIPLLKNARFTPALKNGKSVNSIKTIEFDLMARDDPKKTTFSKIPGYLPKQDMYGNIILN